VAHAGAREEDDARRPDGPGGHGRTPGDSCGAPVATLLLVIMNTAQGWVD
jgi:hypothetical protein